MGSLSAFIALEIIHADLLCLLPHFSFFPSDDFETFPLEVHQGDSG